MCVSKKFHQIDSWSKDPVINKSKYKTDRIIIPHDSKKKLRLYNLSCLHYNLSIKKDGPRHLMNKV